MICFCSNPMNIMLAIYMHNLASYSYFLYTYAAGYILNLMVKPYLRHICKYAMLTSFVWSLHVLKVEMSI